MLDFSSLPPSWRMSPGGRDQLEAADVVADGAVLDGPAAARVRRDQAAHHGALVARMGREVEAALLDGLGEIGQADAGFGHGHLVVGVDLEDAGHPLERQDDAAADGDASAAEPGRPAARRDRDALGVGDPEHGRDLGGRSRADDEVGLMGDLLSSRIRRGRSRGSCRSRRTRSRADNGFDLGPDGRRDRRGHGGTPFSRCA